LPENPLLPHRKLKELYTLMLRCRELERRQHARTGSRVALLAATAMHLLPGDVLCGEANDAIAEELAPVGKTGKIPGYMSPKLEARLPACAALARGLQAAGTDGVVLAYVSAGAKESGWAEALAWAHETQLPLILACADATGTSKVRKATKRSEAPLTWATLNELSKKLLLPILAVDGEDAVAVYRCMQESVIRARHGGGPAIIWAVTTHPSKPLPRSLRPLSRLENYLKVRNIQLPKRS
jgi:hypothetical protein